ncbi:tRNA1(Val) (adenine(37)-N6)-methyltransferase [Consotaella aegiceratis]|uniref:tRNA1(Val) (adenine(37)-N6)-methyltransferase n=1 Tax=Consotaella aegiceratis TaxID=3097961 RepID=UPI002F3F20D9
MSSPEADRSAATAGLETTLDGFFGGRFQLFQPRGAGHRAGLDAMLLAATVGASQVGHAADLGAGTGVVGFAAAARASMLDMALVEINPSMAMLARQSIEVADNAGLAPRLRVIETDVLATRPGREAAGLFDESFDLVLSNPPFHEARGRRSPDALRAEARHMEGTGFLDRWVRTAAALLKSRGRLSMIVRPEVVGEVLAAAQGRLGDLGLVPVHAHPAKPAIRLLVSARKASRGGLSLLPPLVLHGPDGGLTPLAEAIAEGTADIAVDG